MSETRKFRTKNGFCHVMHDRIVFTHSGWVGILGDLVGEGQMRRVLLFFSTLAALALYLGYYNYDQNRLFWAGFFGLVGLYMIYGIFKNWNTTLDPILERESIKEVIYHQAKDSLGFPSFEVRIQDEKGNRRRIIALPRMSKKNKRDVQSAVGIMVQEGLISAP